jgi:UDP-2-acetamido-2,6-beta-L-arabino-hexul-4-ose reductase
MKVLVTGADGFIGRNLQVGLERIKDTKVLSFDLSSGAALTDLLDEADIVIHLAGVNRPKNPTEYHQWNLGLTAGIADHLERQKRPLPIVFSSSTQAELDNDYGRSKLAAEERLRRYSRSCDAAVRIFRFPNVFGKWCRPNYNSAVATFCHNIAHGLPIQIREGDAPLHLVYIDDVVEAIIRESTAAVGSAGFSFADVAPMYQTTVGSVADAIRLLDRSRHSGVLPDFSDSFLRKLNSTYLSYLEPAELPVAADMKRDERGWLFELVKSAKGGQIFVSTTRPGRRRGNHFHDTKVEKFCVIQGTARISLRRIDGKERVDFDVDGDAVKIVDIPPGYTHSIVNTGDRDCITIFWANEIFDPSRSDTYPLEV